MYAWVAIDTRDIDTDELIQELKRRKQDKDLFCDDMAMQTVIAGYQATRSLLMVIVYLSLVVFVWIK